MAPTGGGLRPRPLRLRLVVTKPTESAANALNYLKYFPYALPCERGKPVVRKEAGRMAGKGAAWFAACLACHTVAIQIKYFNILLAATATAAAAALGRIPRCV